MTSPPHVPSRLTDEMRAFTDATPGGPPRAALLAELERLDRSTDRGRAASLPLGVRRWGGVVAVAMSVALVVLALGAGLPRLLGGEPPVADGVPGEARLIGAIPDSIDEPSRWLPVDPAPGPAAATIIEPRRAQFWGGSRTGLNAISAEDGSYAWVDLPAYNVRIGPALSPTGRWVAVWAKLDPQFPRRSTDVLVYDLTDGSRALVTPPRSEGGITPLSLTWIDEDTLVTDSQTLPRREPALPQPRPSLIVEAATGESREASDGSPLNELYNGAAAHPAGLLLLRARVGLVVDDQGAVTQRVSLPVRGGMDPGATALSPTGDRLAYLETSTTDELPDYQVLHVVDALTPDQSSAGRVASTQDRRVADYGLRRLIGWVDDDRVVAEAVTEDRSVVLSISLSTGRTAELSTSGFDVYAEYASALWQRPTVDRGGQGFHLNPRLALIVAGLAVVVAVFRRVRHGAVLPDRLRRRGVA